MSETVPPARLDFHLVVQSDFVPRLAPDAPGVSWRFEDSQLNILGSDPGCLRDAFVYLSDECLLGFDGTPRKDTDFDDRVSIGAIGWINEVRFGEHDEAMEFLVWWILESLHD